MNFPLFLFLNDPLIVRGNPEIHRDQIARVAQFPWRIKVNLDGES